MPLLTPITDGDEKLFVEIAAAKRGKRRIRLVNVWPEIEKRYEHYKDRAAALEMLDASHLSKIRQNDLKHCYDKPTRPLSDLIGRVLSIVPASQSTMCQYCLIGEIDSVDHYAPKDLFPEFAIFPRNLVASCSRCNRLKSSKWVANGVREIFNPYFEEFPKDQFLSVDIDFPSGDRSKVSFELRRPSGISPRCFARIERQLQILQLIDRYNTAGAEIVDDHRMSIRALPNNKRSTARRFLKLVASEVEAKFGLNHMRRIICLNLASNDAFMDVAGMA